MQSNQKQTKDQPYLGLYITKDGHELYAEQYKISLTIPGKKYVHS